MCISFSFLQICFEKNSQHRYILLLALLSFSVSFMGKTKAAFSVLCAFLVVLVAALFVYWETSKNRHPAPIFQRERLVDIEFEDGLGRGHRAFELVEKSTIDQTRYRLLKKVWQKNRPLLAKPEPQPKIPKIIHQIWLGPKYPPSFFSKFSNEWKRAHPDWEYRLWTDADLNTFDFELKDLFEQSTNYGEKADILRCEILDKFGGMYVDTDFECIKPFDEVMDRYDFFAGIEPPHEIPETNRVLLISDALIGCRPGHPILKRWKELIRRRWQKDENECFNPIEKVLKRTFFTFGRAIEDRIETGEYCNIIFPSTYFYPIKPRYLREPPESPPLIKKILLMFGMKNDHSFYRVCPETLAVHHFAARWQKSSNQLFKEMHQEMVKLRRQQAKLMHEVEELRQSLPCEKGEKDAA